MATPPPIILSVQRPATAPPNDEDYLANSTIAIVIANASTSLTISAISPIRIGSTSNSPPSQLTRFRNAFTLTGDKHTEAVDADIQCPRSKSSLTPSKQVLHHIIVAGFCLIHVVSPVLQFGAKLRPALCPNEGTIMCPFSSQAKWMASVLLAIAAVAVVIVRTLGHGPNVRLLRERIMGQANTNEYRPDEMGMRRTHRSSTTSRPSLDHAMVCPGSSHLPYPEDKSISKTVVHFEEASYLAQGSSGEVHRARLDGHKGPVAVKAFRLPRNATERHRSEIAFAREVRIWSRLDHPNILPLIGYCHNCAENISWFISPFIGGGNIREYLERTNPDMQVRYQLVIDTAAGLTYLHHKLTCHGDLKAANVLVDVITGRPKALLCDFGLSEVRESQPSGLVTSSFDRKGSVRYFSPELVCEDPHRNLESDVWAWGCVVLEITTDMIPYNQVKDSSVVVFKVIANEPPALVDNLNVNDTIRGLLKRNAAEPFGQWPELFRRVGAYGRHVFLS